MRFIITLISSLLISTPSFADEVWYCDMTNRARIMEGLTNHYSEERFTMKVSSEKVSFKGGNLNGVNMQITFPGNNFWIAKGQDNQMISTFDYPNLWFAAFHYGVLAFHAKCEKF